jgi:NADH-quinone oxidoreductase subunit L
VTAIFAASIGIVQTDIKRVLAYSTVSQLGYMFLACGVAAYSAGIFHLMTHAFFKALLFLSAGSVIHGMSGEQDMRRMGGLRKYMPWTFWVMTIATFAIAGIPPLAGFWSKDEILWRAWLGNPILWAIGAITAFMTSFYMFRLWFLTFFGKLRADEVIDANQEPTGGVHAPTGAPAHAGHDHDPGHAVHALAHDDHGHGHGHGHHPHESPMVMIAPLVVLAILSAIGGFVGAGNRFEKFLAPVFEQYAVVQTAEAQNTVAVPHHETPEAEHHAAVSPEAVGSHANEPEENHGLETGLMVLSVALALGGLGLAYFFYAVDLNRPKRAAQRMRGIYNLLVHKYWVDELYGKTIIQPILRGSTNILWKDVDAQVIDGTVNGAGRLASAFGGVTRRMQSGLIRSYAAWVAAGAACVIAYMVYLGVSR